MSLETPPGGGNEESAHSADDEVLTAIFSEIRARSPDIYGEILKLTGEILDRLRARAVASGPFASAALFGAQRRKMSA